jgi:hypothetical protein
MNYKKVTTKEANGTSYMGSIQTTYSYLISKFGEPVSLKSGDGKVNCEWVLKFDDGVVATIYDWKTGSIPMDKYDWHIGGRTSKALEYVRSLLSL